MRRLYWDIETSPNVGVFWQSGYKLSIPPENIIRERAIICICYKWEGEDEVRSLAWKSGNDKKLVEKFSKIAQEADELVAHNGDNFDLKWFQGRHLIHGLPPIPRSKTVDTLKIARKNFRLNSNKLDYLAKLLLGEGKIDVPFSLWLRCMENEASALSEMITYCKKDVVLLERVYNRLAAYDLPHTHVGVQNGSARWTCPHCGSKEVRLDKSKPTAKGIIQRQMRCDECHRYYTICDSVYKDHLADKDGEK